MMIEIVIPVFNEEAKITACLAQLKRFLTQSPDLWCQITIADNGSTDRTLEKAKAVCQLHSNIVLSHLLQKGRGGALRSVWLASQADILSYMDVDLSTDLTAFPKAIQVLAEQQFDFAIGSRLLPESIITRCWRREIISRAYNHLVRTLFHTHFTDAQCGFKAITRSAAQQLLPLVEDTQWFFDTELLILAEKLGYRIYDIPVKWVENPDSRVKVFRTILQDLQGLMRMKRNFKKGKYDLHPFQQSRPVKAC